MKTPISIMYIIMLNLSMIHSAPLSQWRGVNRDGIYNDEKLLKEWPENGPDLLWSQDSLGAGWSSVAIEDDHLFLTGTKDTTDYLTAVNKSGKFIWQIPFARSWPGTFPHARSTPATESGKVYLISSLGTVLCVDGASSKIEWQIDGLKKFVGDYVYFGVVESPLLVDNKLIYTPCGPMTTMVALNKQNGETIWQTESLNDSSSYASPTTFEYAGKQMIVTVTASQVLAVDAADGTILWTYPFLQFYGNNTNTPLYHDGQIYVTSGYNHVGVMLNLTADGSDITLAWSDSTLDVHHGGVVRVGDYIFGSNWLDNKNGNWCALDWKTGKVMYEKKWISKGSIISASGMLYCYAERRGFFGLAKANSDDFTLVSSFQIEKGNGQHWSHPVIKDGILYIRHGDVLMAYNIQAKPRSKKF